MIHVLTRSCAPAHAEALQRGGLHPVLARLYAARGIRTVQDIETDLSRLLPPDTLKGIEEATALLADAIEAHKRICVIADTTVTAPPRARSQCAGCAGLAHRSIISSRTALNMAMAFHRRLSRSRRSAVLRCWSQSITGLRASRALPARNRSASMC